MHARTVLSLCDRFHCLPSQLAKEDTAVLRLLKIESIARPPEPEMDGLE